MHRKNIFPKLNSKNYKFSVFFLPEFLYRQCRNRNRNSMFLFRSPPRRKLLSKLYECMFLIILIIITVNLM